MDHATTHKLSGWDCARCGLPLFDSMPVRCPECGSTHFVINSIEED